MKFETADLLNEEGKRALRNIEARYRRSLVSWVLILVSPETMRPPAVIGGYRSQEEAEQAGILATRPIPGRFGDSDWDYPPEFYAFTVIPGAAVEGPVGVSHSKLDRVSKGQPGDPGYGKLTRHHYRFVADGKENDNGQGQGTDEQERSEDGDRRPADADGGA